MVTLRLRQVEAGRAQAVHERHVEDLAERAEHVDGEKAFESGDVNAPERAF